MHNLNRPSSGPNHAVTGLLLEHETLIISELKALQRENPNDPTCVDVDRLGGIRNLALSFDRIRDLHDGNTQKIGPSNASFLVAYLNSPNIRSFIAAQSGTTEADVYEIMETFLSFIR
ncbi:MAG: hypothetical protein OEY44_04620 [Candidatus Peregrinibacteria bacterium]|nr:hypothetical protein [Candidatus Peregrinibacteria bacterium]